MNTASDKPQLQFHFLTGVSRAGITWLSRSLNQHPDVAIFGQSRLWGKHFIQPDVNGNYRQQHLDRLVDKSRAFEWNATVGTGPGCIPNMQIGDSRRLLVNTVESLTDPVAPRDVYISMATAVAALKHARIAIKKTPHHVLHADQNREHFPNTRFVLLQCDPLVHMAVLKGQADLKYHPLAAALIWRKYHTAIAEQCGRYPTQTSVVNAADLATHSAHVLSRLANDLSIATYTWPDAMELFDYELSGSPLPRLDAADMFWMQYVYRLPLSHRLTKNACSVKLLHSLYRLPAYLVHNITVSTREVEGSLLDYYRCWLFNERS